jgi:hypothetical protein
LMKRASLNASVSRNSAVMNSQSFHSDGGDARLRDPGEDLVTVKPPAGVAR